MGTAAVDICERARDALVAAGAGKVLVRRLDGLSGREGVVVRPMPGTVVSSYYDGSRDVVLRFQVVVKRRSPVEAMDWCDAAVAAILGADLSSANGSYDLAGPAWVEEDAQEVALGDDEMHVWAVRFGAAATRRE